VFIIADVGSNYRNYQDCVESIIEAKKCGADAVKFQMYSPDHLYGNYKLAPAKKGGITQLWIKDLVETCRDYEIEFMCSTFAPGMLNVIDKYADRHKIASAELKYPALLEEARDAGKPVYISTAASTEREIEECLDIFGGARDLVTLLYCVGAYPALEEYYDLKKIGYLASKFRVAVGLSDHTKSIIDPTEYGATCLEKHFKLRDFDTPDQGHSFGPENFKAMVKTIRSNKFKYEPLPCERDFVEKHNRRLIAITNIRPGDKFRYNLNYGAFRSSRVCNDYISPFDQDRIEGKLSKALVLAGKPITMRCVS